MQNRNSISWQKKAILATSMTLLGGSIGYWLAHRSDTSALHRYAFAGDERDIKAVEQLFEDPDNRYLLTTRDWYDVRTMMLNRMSDFSDPATYGDLTIKIAREKDTDAFVGFTAHHPLSFYKSKLLFLAVAPDMRGKGYGRALAQGALDDMKAEGALKAVLDVREENTPARKLYNSLGFKDRSISGGFVRTEIFLD